MKTKIKQGKSYPFIISNQVTLPNGKDCYVLLDPNNVKHLLDSKYYIKYNFKPKQTIKCRIDKINCTGKIYIEPHHPYYKIGKAFDFPFLNIEKKNISKQSAESFAVFKDIFENKIRMPSNEIFEKLVKGNSYRFLVKKIKKGRVFITAKMDKDPFAEFKEGVEYPFQISQLRNYPDKYSFYLLKETKGKSYELRSKFYTDYDLNLGQKIYCRVIKDSDESFLEPRHPKYIPGKEYDFEIIRQDYIDDYDKGKIKVYVLKNNFGKDVFIPIKSIPQKKIRLDKVKCRVVEIKKSRLYLEC